ncbi:MAG: hypothetical protein D6704_09345 [Nitrospirae bacterium]|nr:MAG: hypothetical protein D6704_09345 [Nitrospirota bacterium]
MATWLNLGEWLNRLRRIVVILAGLMVLSPPVQGREGKEHFLLRDDGRIRGHAHAPVTLLEYSDFTCGFCTKFFRETWPRLWAEYVQIGKVRLVYRDFPRSLQGPSLDTALAARCAGEQGRYWRMHDHLFTVSTPAYDLTSLRRYAEKLGLDVTQFTACMQSDRYQGPIFRDRLEGGSLGIRGTPAFVLFLTQQGRNGPVLLIPGAFPYEVFQAQIDRLLQLASAPPSPASHEKGLP